MIDAISAGRLAKVHPELGRRVMAMLERCEAAGFEVRVVQGLRTNDEQDQLYAQGRTIPGKIVTNCRGGHSYHNFGLAVDCVPSINGLDANYQPDWNREHPAWKVMVEAGKAQGLDAGAEWRTFPDFPHFQFTGRFPEGAPNEEVRELYSKGGLADVWAQISASS